MRNLIVISIVLLFILTSCINKIPNSKGVAVGSSYGFSVKPGIDEYSLTMSSVPGLPIDITCDNNSGTELNLIAKCEGGSFLLWKKDRTVEDIGKTFKGEFEETTIYWSPIEENGEITKESVNFTVSVYNVELDKEINKVDGVFSINDEKNYIVTIK